MLCISLNLLYFICIYMYSIHNCTSMENVSEHGTNTLPNTLSQYSFRKETCQQGRKFIELAAKALWISPVEAGPCRPHFKKSTHVIHHIWRSLQMLDLSWIKKMTCIYLIDHGFCLKFTCHFDPHTLHFFQALCLLKANRPTTQAQVSGVYELPFRGHLCGMRAVDF